MKTTRLSEKLNNKRGASILVALVLFLVVTMTSVMVLTAVTANAGRLQKQKSQEQAKALTDSLVSAVNYQIKNTDMIMKFKVKSDATEEQLVNDPISCVDQGGVKSQSDAVPKYVVPISTSPLTLFCAYYINETAIKIVYKGIGGNVTGCNFEGITLSPSDSSSKVSMAYNGLVGRIHLDAMDTESFAISGYIAVKKGGKQISSTKFKIPATVRGYTESSINWNDDSKFKETNTTGYVEIKWGEIITY